MTDATAEGAPTILRTEVSAQGVGLIQMRDAASNNALSEQMVGALEEAFHVLGRDERVSAIVLSGLPDIFSSGASAEILTGLVSGRLESTELLLPRLLLECPVPTVAAMEGHAVGGGFALGIAADIVLLSRESRYCLNFMDLGFTPGMGTTRLLEHVLSPALAHELLYTGEARRGTAFEGRSGINYILPQAEVLARATDVAERIAEKPRVALKVLKAALSLPRREAFEAARTQEAHMHAISFAQPDLAKQIRDLLARRIGEEGQT